MRNGIGKLAAMVTFVTASAAASAAARADDIVIFNTGVDSSHHVISTGAADPHWSVIQVPAGSGFSVPRLATIAAAHPAYVPNSAVGSTGSSWISLLNNTNNFFATGTYVYRVTFDLTGLDPTTAVIDGTLAVDDSVSDLRVNGASFGALGGMFVAMNTSFHIASGFQSGVNTIDFQVLNAGASANPTGIRVAIHGTASPADSQAPVITGVYDRTIPWQGSQITLVAATLGITANDNVDGSVPVTLTPNVVGLGAHVITASAQDAHGNAATSTFTVTVLDVTAPVITGPSPATPTFEWHGSAISLTSAALGLSATDDVDATVTVTLSPATAGVGTTSVTARAADAAGNIATKTFNVSVVDVTAPVITGPSPATPTFEWHGSAISLTAAALGLSATDDVNGTVTVTLSPATAGLGTTSVTARAADATGNFSTRSFNVSVLDVTAPVITGPSPATPTFEWHGSAISLTAAALGLSATDDVDGTVAVTLSPATAGLGTTSVTARAADAAGNFSTRSFNVSVLDVTAPVLTGPSPATPTFEWSGSAISLTPSLLGLSAADDVDGAVSVSLSPATAGLGTTSVTAQATDVAGNTSTKTFNVRVADTTAPVFLSLHVSPDVLDAKNHSMAQVTVSASVADAGDPSPTVRITSIACTDDDLVFAAGLSNTDWSVTSALTADVRCERTGKGSGRTYVLTVECADASGNTSSATVSVFVPHDNGKKSGK
jgi:hypothetical protein